MINKFKIISVSPNSSQYARLEKIFLKKYVQSLNIDEEELKSKFDIIEGSTMGGCSNTIEAIKIKKKQLPEMNWEEYAESPKLIAEDYLDWLTNKEI